MKSIIIDGISCIVETIIMVYFIESACKRRAVRSLTSRAHTFFILLLADLGISFLSIPLYIQISVLFSACMLVLLVFYTGNVIKKIYFSIMLVLLTIASSMLALYIVSWVSNINYAELISRSDIIRILTNIASKLFYFISVKIVLKYLRKEKIHVSTHTTLIYAVLLIASVLAIVKIRNGLFNCKIDAVFSTYITIVIIIVDLCLYLMLHYYSESSQRQLDIEMQKLTIQQQQKDIETIIQDYYEILKIRHDIKRNISSAAEMFNEKEYDKLGAFIKSFQNNSIGNIKTYVNTSNRMFNAIINQKLNEAEQRNIKIECFIFNDLSDFNGMSDQELCLIFLNLLDNAIEAEAEVEDPIIKLNIFQNRGYVCFKIENIVDKNILETNPNLHTTKQDKRMHGVGLKSVREIIDRHDGIFNISQNEKWFSAEIMLLKHDV